MKRIMKRLAVLACMLGAGLANAGSLTTDDLTVRGEAAFYGNVRIQQYSVEDIPTNGLILYYNFDSDNGTNIVDQTPLSNNATAYGAYYTTGGRKNGGFYFDNPSGGTNYFAIKPGAISGLDQGSISYWIYGMVPHDMSFMGFCLKNEADDIYVESRTFGPYAYPAIVLGSWTNQMTLMANVSISAYQWLHFVGTWNTTSAQLYMNGVLIASTNDAQNRCKIKTTSQSFWFGRDNTTTNDTYSHYGYVDDIRVYNTVLTSQQVYQAYASAMTSGKFEITGAGLVVSNSITQISGAATNVFTGKMGVGTNSPAEALHVNGKLRLEDNLILNGHWLSGDGGNEGVFVDNDGKVGINTTNPVGVLSFGSTINDNMLNLYEGGSSDTYGFGIAAGNLKIKTATAGAVTFNQAGTERMRVNTDGKVGIGTSSPGQLLHVAGNVRADCVMINSSSTWGSEKFYVSGNALFDTGGVGIGWNAAAIPPAQSLVVAGNVGIGTNSPAQKLHVAGTGTLPMILESSSYSSTLDFKSSYGSAYAGNYYGNAYVQPGSGKDFNVYDGTSGAAALTVKNGGNVGIGTNIPSTKLHVAGEARIESHLRMPGGTAIYLGNDEASRVVRSGDATGQDLFIDNVASSRSIALRTGDYQQRLTVLQNGNVGIGTSDPDERLTLAHDSKIGWEYSGSEHGVYHYIQHPTDATYLEFDSVATSSATWPAFVYYTYYGGTKTEIQRVSVNGNVGIGTNEPLERLVVDGAAKFSQGIKYIPALGDISMGSYTNGL